jgi:maltodextrin utilization protein YvdJ
LRGLPIDINDLLSTKAIAVIERCWWWALIAIVSVFISLAHQKISMAIAVGCMMIAGFVLVLGIGAWLTVRSTTEIKAFRHIMPIAVIVIGIPVLVANSIAPKDYDYYAGHLSYVAVATVFLGALAWKRGCWELERME